MGGDSGSWNGVGGRASCQVKAGLGAGEKKGDSGRGHERGGVTVGVGTGGKRERGKRGGGGPGGGVGMWVVMRTKASTAAVSRMRDRPSAKRMEGRRGPRSRMRNGAELKFANLDRTALFGMQVGVPTRRRNLQPLLPGRGMLEQVREAGPGEGERGLDGRQ